MVKSSVAVLIIGSYVVVGMCRFFPVAFRLFLDSLSPLFKQRRLSVFTPWWAPLNQYDNENLFVLF
jgi:hypothetical protein